jgi:hypothetical protein
MAMIIVQCTLATEMLTLHAQKNKPFTVFEILELKVLLRGIQLTLAQRF